MLKKKKTMASGKLVLVKSVRRTRSHRIKFCVQRGLGRCPQQASGEENYGGILHSAGRCVLTPALLATMSLPLKGRRKNVLFRGSYPSYNEGVIGLTGHCRLYREFLITAFLYL